MSNFAIGGKKIEIINIKSILFLKINDETPVQLNEEFPWKGKWRDIGYLIDYLSMVECGIFSNENVDELINLALS
jgi:hypothetical protein